VASFKSGECRGQRPRLIMWPLKTSCRAFKYVTVTLAAAIGFLFHESLCLLLVMQFCQPFNAIRTCVDSDTLFNGMFSVYFMKKKLLFDVR
jgi:hypothetical protein